MANINIASIIADQLTHAPDGQGYGRLVAMLGAKMTVGKDSLGIRFKMNPKMNHCRITLMPSDTYKVEFFQVRGVNCKSLNCYEDIYAEDLRPLFESETGLVTALR